MYLAYGFMVDEDREVFVYLSQEWFEQLSLSNIGTVLRNSNIIGHHACSREIKTKNEMLDVVFLSTG